MKWSDSPLVRIGRNGDWFELGRDPEASPALHLWGSEGLGLAPVDIAKSDRITSDGSIVRGVRYTDREVYLPALLEADSMLELNEIRQHLYDLLAPDLGPVEVQLEIPTGEGQEPNHRSIFGYLTEGLDGKFGEDYYGSRQKLGLTFTCPDPWWLGPERTRTLQINPGSKPFLSDYEYSRRNFALNPQTVDLRAQGHDGTVSNSGGAVVSLSADWPGGGHTSIKIAPGDSNAGGAWLTPYRSTFDPAHLNFPELVGKKVTVGVDMYLPATQTGSINSLARSIGIGFFDSTGAPGIPSAHWSASAPNTPGVHRIVHTVTIPADAKDVTLCVRNGSTSGPVYVSNVTVESGATDGSYFDGDTTGARWLGSPGASESGIVVPGSGVPFFPIVLAPSNVVGEWDIDIAGAGDVWPTWEITGPGSDLLIQRDSERIFIQGQFASGSMTRIQTEPARITPDRWADLSLDSRLFPLRAGSNRVKVSMVGATADTLVRLVWRERYRGAI
ncbi:phage tail family protein [Brachybacterium halotolerans subsp. kimchii]|uniref:phage distal tail protein n=1 Tax=Brachybacterium halotolerans TaxID=2795215 RepID=UPI001E2B7687|nr:phage tail domain-containing protein [Brachybacterium halotolerans]UEJ84017.1 phage tail family protein [Brachybacterium halotolerans subsp. kimchii]